jgi:predicted permease
MVLEASRTSPAREPALSTMNSGLWPTFIAAVQAAVSILFTIFWGLLAGYFEVLDDHSAQKLSQLCVNMLLPALLVTNVGSELNSNNVARYSAIVGM